MYSTLLEFTKNYLAANVTSDPVQVGYYGEFPTIDLRQAAILLEPKMDSQDPNTNVWLRGEYQIRLWILVAMDIDYIASLRDLEHILGAEDDGQAVFGLNATLKKMSRDPLYEALSGSMGGKSWRIGPGGLRTKGPQFSIQQRANGTRINTALLELYLKIETQR